MKKFLKVLLNTILILVVVVAVGWYYYGDELFSMFMPKEEQVEQTAQALTVTSEEPAVVAEPEPAPVNADTSILFTGDVEISTYVQSAYDAGGIGSVASEEIQSLMNDATFTMINNEFCYSERGQQAPDKQFTFRVNPSYVSILNELGVDIAGLANNHVLDYGHDALADTFTTLTNAGIDFTGAGNSLEEASKLIIKTDEMGRTYGFLAASHVIPTGSWNVLNSQPGEFCFYDETDLLKAIEAARPQVDYLFVMVHWGVERTTELEDYQVNDGHKMIDAGADAVIGMHSHCLQPIEMYNGKPIFYSLGNFIFNQTIPSGGGGAVEVNVNQDNEISYIIHTIQATNTKTSIDAAGRDYIESISSNVAIDENGFITEVH
jgi:poly-gamma-glutamate synthesis protein (capsule biosynthesis protein)